MMGWKEWPAWAKGGIILGVFNLLLFLVHLIFTLFSEAYSKADIQIFILLPALIVDELEFLPKDNFFGLFLSSLILFVIGGAVIGWIVGKIKARRAAVSN